MNDSELSWIKNEWKSPLLVNDLSRYIELYKVLDKTKSNGELHALSWDQIDLEKGVIVVDRSYDSNAKKFGSTKGRYWRTVQISSSLKSLIVDLKQNPEVKALPCRLKHF